MSPSLTLGIMMEGGRLLGWLNYVQCGQRRGGSSCVRGSWERLLGEQMGALFQALLFGFHTNTVLKSRDSYVRQTWAESPLGYSLMWEFEQISHPL